MKRIAVISDTHCGHRFGVTPPEWQNSLVQKLVWDWLVEQAEWAGEVYAVIGLGDMIDGPAFKNYGVELLTTDRIVQCEMAAVTMRVFNNPSGKMHIVAGTAYHSGSHEDWERVLSEMLHCDFSSELITKIEKLTFHFRHHTGTSGTPYGQSGILSKDKLMTNLRMQYEIGEGCDVAVRAHAHRYTYVEDESGAIVLTPGMQVNSNFGRRRCNGTTNIGIVFFDIDGDGFSCHKRMFRLREHAPQRISQL